MITGIGLDIVELDRLRKLDDRSDKFRKRILTPQELTEYEMLRAARRTEFLAGRFAAKEAFSKALGTGIGKECSFQDIEIRKRNSGKPDVFYKGQLMGLLSITHTSAYAAAQVLLQSEQKKGDLNDSLQTD